MMSAAMPQEGLKKSVTLALLSGVFFFASMSLSGWRVLRDAPNMAIKQADTRMGMRRITRLLREYHKEHGHWPAKLTDIPDISQSALFPGDLLRDGWHRPYEYTVAEGQYTLVSRGRDGMPGGIGLDGDIYHDGRNRLQTPATFRQFFFSDEINARDFVTASALASMMVALTIFVTAQKSRGQGKPLTGLRLFASVAVTLVLAWLVALLLLPFHIPSGH